MALFGPWGTASSIVGYDTKYDTFYVMCESHGHGLFIPVCECVYGYIIKMYVESHFRSGSALFDSAIPNVTKCSAADEKARSLRNGEADMEAYTVNVLKDVQPPPRAVQGGGHNTKAFSLAEPRMPVLLHSPLLLVVLSEENE